MSEPRLKYSPGKRRRRGLSLVEVMIAMVIMSFGLLGVAALQVRAITEGAGGKHLSAASAIARNRIESLNTIAWGDASLLDSAAAWNAAAPTVTPDVTYVVSVRISNNTPTEAATTIKSIDVRVAWSDAKRQNRNVVLSSARLRELDE